MFKSLLVRSLFSAGVLALLSLSPINASELGDKAAAAQPGSFVKMNVPGFDNDLLFWEGRHGFAYSDSMKWDPTQRQVYFTGAGHLVTTKLLVYTEANNTWQTRTAGSSGLTSHGYDHAAMDAQGRKYFFREFNSSRVEIYDMESQRWSRSSEFSGNKQVAGGLAWFPEMQRLIFVDERRGILAYNPNSNSWSNLLASDQIVAGKYHNFAEYSPVHRVVIGGGGNGSRSVYKVEPSGSVSRMDDAPFTLGVTQSVVTVDPVSGNFIVVKPNGDFMEYNPTNDQWQSISANLPSELLQNSGDSGGWGLLATPVSTHGVILFAKYNGDNSSMYIYKHAAGSGSPPPPPDPAPTVSLTATPDSVTAGGSSTVEWVVSEADSCTASGSGWSGTKAADGGSETVSGIASEAVFELTCMGTGGTGSDSATVTINSSGGGGGGGAGGGSGSGSGGGGSSGSSGSADADWATRSTAPGVLMATRFDSESEVSDWKTSSKQENIVWDTNLKTSGAGSMRMNVLSTDTTSSGNWRRYLSDDQRQFDPGDEFYVQFRQYVPAYLIEHRFKGTQYGGIYSQGFKSSIISHFRNSNTNFEVVVQNSGQLGYIQGYHQDGVNTAIKWSTGANTACQGSDFRHQPAIDHGPQNVGTPCENDRARYGGLYSYLNSQGGTRGDPDPFTGAFVYSKDAWITILQRIKISPSGYGSSDNVIETWAAEDGEDYVLLASLDDVKFGGAGKFDTLWLLHYRSKGQSDSSRQNTFTNYDEVIVSTEFIPAPGQAAVSGSQVKPERISDLVAQ